MNIMVTLAKIKKVNNIISVEYFPEDRKDDIGAIVYDIEKKIVVEYDYCKTDNESFLKTYFKKAISAIEKCIKEDNFPETVEYMWY